MITNYLYIIFFIISIYCTINTSYKIHKKWLPKALIFYFGVLCYIISITSNNSIINKYIFPFAVFINILILIYITLSHKLSLLNLLGLLGLLYFLYTFNYTDFELSNGLLVRTNKELICLYVISLIIYFCLTDYVHIYNKIGLTILVLYPLIFPLNEYFKHRIITLFLAGSVWNYLIYKKIIRIAD